jgi:hypothetical protein
MAVPVEVALLAEDVLVVSIVAGFLLQKGSKDTMSTSRLKKTETDQSG